MRPSKGRSKAWHSASVSPSNRSLSTPQCGHKYWLMFSTIPSTLIPRSRAYAMDFCTTSEAISDGVVTTMAPSRSGMNPAITGGLSAAAPGGRSVSK